MDGAPPRLIAGTRALVARTCIAVAATLAAEATLAQGQGFQVQGSCRDGVPHGAWQLAADDGSLRALGAFARGKRTGSFIFWNAAGVRIAHIPYEENAKHGTLALWYQTAAKGRDAQQRLEAVYTHGKLNGFVRIWTPDGQVRGEYAYADGRLAAARAWDEAGRELPEGQAREQARKDVTAHEGYYETLESLVASNLPACDPYAPPKPP